MMMKTKVFLRVTARDGTRTVTNPAAGTLASAVQGADAVARLCGALHNGATRTAIWPGDGYAEAVWPDGSKLTIFAEEIVDGYGR